MSLTHRRYRMDVDAYPRNEFIWCEEDMAVVVNAIWELAEGPVNEEGYSLVLAIDTETTGLNLMKDAIIVSSFYVPHPLTIPELDIHNEYVAWVAPGPVINCHEYQELLVPLLQHQNVLKVGHNLSGYDWFMFRNAGIYIEEPIHDTIPMSWLHNENKVSHELKRLMALFFNRHMDPFSKHSSLDIRDWDFDTMVNYAGLDAFAHFEVWAELRKRLMAFELANGMTAWEFYREFLVPFQSVLRNMMCRGISIDMDFLASLAEDVLGAEEDLQRWFNTEWVRMQAERGTFYITKAEERNDDSRRMRGLDPKVTGVRPINLNSTPQLRYLFFGLLKRKVLKKTKPGKTGEQAASLAAEILEEYINTEGCEYAEKLLEFRQLNKIYGTYIGDDPDDDVPIGRHKPKGGLRRKVINGRVYTTLKLGPVTGRLASANPNLQNIPARTELGKKIRFAFRAPPGHKLICADYSQLEMRLFAHFAQEPVMIEAIREGKDLHCATAALMFGMQYEDVHIAKLKNDDEASKLHDLYGIETLDLSLAEKTYLSQRRAAKNIGFGLTKTNSFAKESTRVSRSKTGENTGKPERRVTRAEGWLQKVSQVQRLEVEPAQQNIILPRGPGYDRCRGKDSLICTYPHALNVQKHWIKSQCDNKVLLYGQGSKRLAGQLGVDVKEAKSLIRRFFNAYPKAQDWIHSVWRECAEDGVVWTYLNRPRRIEEIRSSVDWIRARSQRQAVNSIIQGCKDADSYVLTDYGPRTLRSLYEDETKPALVSHTTVQNEYTVYDTGKKEVFNVITTHGTDRVTRDHKFFTYEHGSITTAKLSELSKGGYILADTRPVSGLASGSSIGTVEEAELIGVLCGDGGDRSFRIDVSSEPNQRHRSLLGLGLVSGKQKQIPSWIFSASTQHRAACLRGLYDTDGGLASDRHPKFTSKSHHLAEGFLLLAQSLGLAGFITRHEKESFVWRVTIRSESVEQFVSLVKPRQEHKADHLPPKSIEMLPPELVEDVASTILSSKCWAETEDMVRIVVNTSEGSWHERGHTYLAKKYFSKGEQAHVYRMNQGSGSAKSCLKFLGRLSSHGDDSPHIRDLIDLCQLVWARIRDIHYVGLRDTMDIEIHGNEHAYIGHGLVQHNSAADIVMSTMLEVEEDLDLKFDGCRLLLQVHDELIFEVPELNAERAIKRVVEIMEVPQDEQMSVPLPVSAHIGDTWGEAK